jgi:apolipoprotein N-acyltransferase
VNSTETPIPAGPSRRQREQRAKRGSTVASLLWALALMGTTFLAKREGIPSAVVLAAVILTALAGVATIVAHFRYLRQTDELRRKIELEALALAFGIGVVGGMSWWLLVVSGVGKGTDLGFVFVAMLLLYSAGILVGCRRYS